MFQKNSIMSLKKKSKSLGHLTALGPGGVGSPNFGSPRMKKHISVKNFNERLKFLNHSYNSAAGGNGGRNNNNAVEEDAVEGAAVTPSSPAAMPAKTASATPAGGSMIPRHHAPPTRSTTALNLGTPMAQARADKQMQARSANAAANAAGKNTPKVRHVLNEPRCSFAYL